MEHTKHILDLASIGTTIASLAGLLPPIAAFVSIMWIGFQFYHSAPVVEWRKRKKGKKK